MYAKLNLCAKKIIIITGMTRSGKTLMSPIISSLERCEQFFLNTIAENILVMNYMKKINFNISDHLIKKTLNECIYDKLLGRNINTRKEDLTSIKLYKKNNIYTKRANSIKRKNIERSKELKNHIFPILFHSALLNLPLIEDSLNNPKIINISRHPIDLIGSWLRKNYGKNHYASSVATVCTYNYKNNLLPFFCLGIEKEFVKQKSNEDRIVKMIYNLNTKFKNNYLKSKNKKNIYLVKLDHFVSDPKKYLKILCNKFKLYENNFLDIVLKEQRCPRKIDLLERQKNKKIIFSKLSEENKKILNKMIANYESSNLTF